MHALFQSFFVLDSCSTPSVHLHRLPYVTALQVKVQIFYLDQDSDRVTTTLKPKLICKEKRLLLL